VRGNDEPCRDRSCDRRRCLRKYAWRRRFVVDARSRLSRRRLVEVPSRRAGIGAQSISWNAKLLRGTASSLAEEMRTLAACHLIVRVHEHHSAVHLSHYTITETILLVFVDAVVVGSCLPKEIMSRFYNSQSVQTIRQSLMWNLPT
jgi:hypothetical protein